VEYTYTKNPDAKRPIIVVDKHIGFDHEDGEGIMGGKFLDEFFDLANSGKTECEVWINSPGGQMMEAYDMASVMKRSSMRPDTLNIGVAASCGGWLQLSGRKVRMMDYATFMCHNPKSEAGSKDAATEAMTLSVAKLISEGSGRNGKAKLSLDEALALMERTTFLTAQECLDMGLCDEIVSSGTNAAYTQMSDKWEAGKFYLNNTIINKNNTMENIHLVTNELELNEGSSAKAIAKAIAKMKNELDTAKENLNTVKAELDKRNDYDDLKNQLDELADKCKALDCENKKLKEENDCLKAKNMVDSYTNKIGNDEAVINEWVRTAKILGIDKVKNMLDKLPVFRNGTKLQTVSPAGNQDAARNVKTMEQVMREKKAARNVKK